MEFKVDYKCPECRKEIKKEYGYYGGIRIFTQIDCDCGYQDYKKIEVGEIREKDRDKLREKVKNLA